MVKNKLNTYMENINIAGEELGVWAKYADDFVNGFWDYLPKMLIAAILFFVGMFVISYVKKALVAFFKRVNFDEALERFLESFLIAVLKMILIVIVVVILGVELSSFMAVFGAMVFAIGMALQGSLSNFAGGVLILIFKPFKLGDFIQTEGVKGKVVDMQIFNTILKTADGIKIILPNGSVSNGTITNWTAIKERRLDIVIGISYDDSIKKAKSHLEKIALKDARVLENKGVKVMVKNLGDNSVDLLLRVWTKRSDYWDTKCDMLETIKLDFDKAKITMPYPQRDIHVYNEK